MGQVCNRACCAPISFGHVYHAKIFTESLVKACNQSTLILYVFTFSIQVYSQSPLEIHTHS